MSEEKKSGSGLGFLLLLSVVLILVLKWSPFGAGNTHQKIGELAPGLNAFPVEGTIPPTTNQVVLVDFWASWCPPCERLAPVISEMHQRFASRGLLVIGISTDADQEGMRQFLRKHPAKYTVVRDAFGHLSQAFHVNTLPRTYVIGADGKFVAAHEGFIPGSTRDELIAQIESALKAADN